MMRLEIVTSTDDVDTDNEDFSPSSASRRNDASSSGHQNQDTNVVATLKPEIVSSSLYDADTDTEEMISSAKDDAETETSTAIADAASSETGG